MAVCVEFQVSASGQPSAGRVVDGLTVLQPLAWQVGNATVAGSSFTCPAGTHVILTPAEISSISSAVSTATGTADAASAAIAAGLKVNVVPYEATSEDYSAISAIFGGILLAAVLVWSSRKLLDLFRDRPEA